MTREEKIKSLYEETYEDENMEEVSLEEMEEALEAYYSAAGFKFKSIDDLFKNHEENAEFIKTIEEKIQAVIKSADKQD